MTNHQIRSDASRARRYLVIWASGFLRHSSFVIRASSLSPLFFEMKHRPLEPLQYDDRKMLTILFLGDIVGEPGRTAVIATPPKLKEKHPCDFIIVHGEHAAPRRSITGTIPIHRSRPGSPRLTPRH